MKDTPTAIEKLVMLMARSVRRNMIREIDLAMRQSLAETLHLDRKTKPLKAIPGMEKSCHNISKVVPKGPLCRGQVHCTEGRARQLTCRGGG